MRKFLVTAVFALALLGMLSPPVFAQAPAPKVTITGLFDQVTAASANVQDGSFGRTSDKEWYARTRFRPDFTFEVGRTKAVMGLEVDLTYGQVGSCGGGPSKTQTTGNLGCSLAHPGTTSDAGLNTDTTGVIEIKWMYTEFDLTGKDSLLPFIPVPTVARAGLQPFASLASYKVTYANGDFAGVSAVTTFAPNLKTNLAYVIVEDEIAGFDRGTGAAVPVASSTAGVTGKATRGNDFAIIASPEYTVFKGLDVKPLYSYFHAEGTTSGSARRSAGDPHFPIAAGSVIPTSTTNSAATFGAASNVTNGSPAFQENRHTIGFDASWRMGPWGLDPTFYYQWGTRDVLAQDIDGRSKRLEAKMNSWLFDVIGSFQTGPLLLEVRGIYSPGNEARDNLSKRIRYFEPLDTDTSYYGGWAGILALGVDYTSGCATSTAGMCTNVGYDRYGRAQLGVRGTYALTPALSAYVAVSPTWTAEKVDIDTTGTRGFVNDRSFVEGDERYLGTELYAGITWKFAPNVAFDLAGSWLSAGKALDTTECVLGATPSGVGKDCTNSAGTNTGAAVRRKADDAYLAAARVRLSF